MNRTISKDRVAVKSGYYFEIFNKSEIPDTLAKYYNKKVELNNVVYDLYHGTSLEDERVIDNMFATLQQYKQPDNLHYHEWHRLFHHIQGAFLQEYSIVLLYQYYVYIPQWTLQNHPLLYISIHFLTLHTTIIYYLEDDV